MDIEKKQFMFEQITDYLNAHADDFDTEMSKAHAYWNEMIDESLAEKKLTDKAQDVLTFIQNNLTPDTPITAAMVAAATDRTPRSVAGTFRTLVNRGYIKKVSDKPAAYILVSD